MAEMKSAVELAMEKLGKLQSEEPQAALTNRPTGAGRIQKPLSPTCCRARAKPAANWASVVNYYWPRPR